MELIALVGLRRSGKDTAARALIDAGYENVKFADVLKAMLRTYLAFRGMPPCQVEAVIEGEMKERPLAVFGGKSARFAMQSLGTEWGRDLIYPDIWVDAAMDRARQFGRVVVTDCRFPNEYAAVKVNGGTVIKITRPGTTVDSHPSESLIASLPYDFEIVNDGSIELLHQRITHLVSNL
jgi:rhodanese-related sulfurtransferase